MSALALLTSSTLLKVYYTEMSRTPYIRASKEETSSIRKPTKTKWEIGNLNFWLVSRPFHPTIWNKWYVVLCLMNLLHIVTVPFWSQHCNSSTKTWPSLQLRTITGEQEKSFPSGWYIFEESLRPKRFGSPLTEAMKSLLSGNSRPRGSLSTGQLQRGWRLWLHQMPQQEDKG